MQNRPTFSFAVSPYEKLAIAGGIPFRFHCDRCTTHRVGGYQPAQKWLDDRAGRALTEADITHYRRTLAALRETIALLPRCDAAFFQVVPTARNE